MARFQLLQKAFVDMRVYEAGEEVTVDKDVIPGPFMKPLDKEAITSYRRFMKEGAPPRKMDDSPFVTFETFDLKEMADASA